MTLKTNKGRVRTLKEKSIRKTIIKKISGSIPIQCYLLLGLPLIGFFLFTLYPILWAFAKSFFYYDQIPSHTIYVGFKNFIHIFTENSIYWKSWLTTLEFTFLKLPFEVVCTLVLAYLLSKKIKGASFIRGVYFMPTVISAVLCSVIFTNLFQYFGFFNDIFIKLGIISEPIDWFANKWSAMAVLVASSVWKNFGTNVLLFTAALTNVPNEVYEAADIDGASAFRKFTSITIPMIAPVFQTILLLAINGTLHVGEFIVTMTNGAPGGATHTVGSYILTNYVPGFTSGTVDIGYGAAISIITSIIYGLVAFGYNKISAKLQNVY